jgi:hypothetical protein
MCQANRVDAMLISSVAHVDSLATLVCTLAIDAENLVMMTVPYYAIFKVRKHP